MKKFFPASMDRLHEILTFIRLEIQKAGFRGTAEIQLELALEEAIVNIIKYAYPESSGNIKVQCIHHPKKGITVVLTDNGISFNPLKVPKKEPESKISRNVQSMGGYGIFLIFRIMDQVEYEYKAGANILSLTKFLTTDLP